MNYEDMTSLADPKPAHRAHLHAASSGAMTCGIALDPFLYQEMKPCARCGGEQIFVAVFECEAGRMGVCLGCGQEKLIPFSRRTEAAA